METTEVKPKSWPTEILAKDWNQRRCFVNGLTQKELDEIHDLPVRDDDVWIVTLPKCGTTWMQELVWLVLNNFDFEAAKQKPLELRSPFLEFWPPEPEGLQIFHELPSPRTLKSHLPLPLLPREVWTKRPKVIYVFRNPKDVFVSAYYFRKNFGRHLNETLAEVLTKNLETELSTQAYWQHVMEFYALRNEPWIYYTSFERMKSDLRQVILDVCAFLEKPITEEQLQLMLHHLSFEEMKKNPQCNHLWEIDLVRKRKNISFEDVRVIRKGKVDGYKEEMPPALIEKYDEWIEDAMKANNLTLRKLLLLE